MLCLSTFLRFLKKICLFFSKFSAFWCSYCVAHTVLIPIEPKMSRNFFLCFCIYWDLKHIKILPILYINHIRIPCTKTVIRTRFLLSSEKLHPSSPNPSANTAVSSPYLSRSLSAFCVAV